MGKHAVPVDMSPRGRLVLSPNRDAIYAHFLIYAGFAKKAKGDYGFMSAPNAPFILAGLADSPKGQQTARFCKNEDISWGQVASIRKLWGDKRPQLGDTHAVPLYL